MQKIKASDIQSSAKSQPDDCHQPNSLPNSRIGDTELFFSLFPPQSVLNPAQPLATAHGDRHQKVQSHIERISKPQTLAVKTNQSLTVTLSAHRPRRADKMTITL